MNCSVAIQFLPMDATTDDETCSAVDQVIAYIDSTGLDYFVGPFETAIEGDYDAAGCRHMMTYAKIDYRPDGDVMSTDHKIGKYHPTDSEFSHAKSEVA